MSTPKRKAPSRIRYEQGHPTVSCRVSRELYERLGEVKQREGKSFSHILKVGLGIVEAEGKVAEELLDEGYRLGYGEGYEAAELRFKVSFTCFVCGETIPVDAEETKRAAREYLEEHGWSHIRCPDKGPTS